jgi:hypothetical protein
VNRIQPFRNIQNRSPGVSLASLPDYEATLRGQPCLSAAVIFHFPLEKCDSYPMAAPFFLRRAPTNFYIFRDLYQRSPLGRFPERDALAC